MDKNKNSKEQEYLHLAKDLFFKGLYKKAIEQYENVLKINSDNDKAIFGLACAYGAIGDRNTAVGYYKKAASMGNKMAKDFLVKNKIEPKEKTKRPVRYEEEPDENDEIYKLFKDQLEDKPNWDNYSEDLDLTYEDLDIPIDDDDE